MMRQIVMTFLTTVLIRIYVHLVTSLWLGLSNHNKALIFQFLNFLTLEFPALLFILWTRIVILWLFFHFLIDLSLLFLSVLLLLLEFWLVISFFLSFLALIVWVSSIASVLAIFSSLLSVVVLATIGSIVFFCFWSLLFFFPFLRLILLYFWLLLRRFFSGSWLRSRLYWLFLIQDLNWNILYYSIMNSLNNLNMFRLSFFILQLLPQNNDLISMHFNFWLHFFWLFLLFLLLLLLFNWNLRLNSLFFANFKLFVVVHKGSDSLLKLFVPRNVPQKLCETDDGLA